MPRRSNKAEEVEEVEEVEAVEDDTEPAVREPAKPGPTTTRSGAKALNVETASGVRTFTSGGEKGQRVAELLQGENEYSRKQIAEIVGCSQSRVAEVARVLGITSARQKTVKPAEETVDA